MKTCQIRIAEAGQVGRCMCKRPFLFFRPFPLTKCLFYDINGGSFFANRKAFWHGFCSETQVFAQNPCREA